MKNNQWIIRIVLYFIISMYLLLFSKEPFVWIHILLYSAVIIWIPIAFQWCARQKMMKASLSNVLLPAGLLYGIAMILPNGILAGLMSLPWLLLAIGSLFKVITKIKEEQSLTKYLTIAAFLFWIVGAVWGLAYQLDYRLIGFPKVIVALTAAHFHFAGFLLTLLTVYLTIFQLQLKWINISVITILMLTGIPLTAVGILFTHLSGIDYLETLASTVMAIAGLSVAFAFLQLSHNLMQKTGALALALGMILALLFAVRNIYPIPWLDIPMMYTWHGSINTIAVGLLVLGSLRKMKV